MILAAAQFFATPLERDRNLEAARRLVRQAAENGAQVVVLPALLNTGYAYAPRLSQAAEPRSGETVETLCALSAELGVVVAGGLLLREGRDVHSALAVAAPGGQPTVYAQRRVWLWERCYFAPGQGPVIAETSVGRLGLLAGWDAADPDLWQAYAGRVDAVLVASALPRFHRAVLNFPLGRKLYLGQLVPALVAQRDALDQLLDRQIAAQAARLGVPVAHAAMSGRFVAALPFPRLSVWLAGLDQPRYWPLAVQAHQATLRATFYGGSAIIAVDGSLAARVGAEEGIALADVALQPQPAASRAPAPARHDWPPTVRLLGRVLRPLAAAHYRRSMRAPKA
jgi:predicted amidohydrolase